MNELWKDIPGYEGLYQASTLGNIRSLDRVIERKRVTAANEEKVTRKGILLKMRTGKKGYKKVNLGSKSYEVHVLIARAFIGTRPEKWETRHLDGNKENNNIENLAYGSKQDNRLDIYAQGKVIQIFDGATAIRIRQIMATGLMTYTEVGRAFGVTPKAIRDIAEGRTFKWV